MVGTNAPPIAFVCVSVCYCVCGVCVCVCPGVLCRGCNLSVHGFIIER